MSLDIDWSLLSSSDPSSLISLLNKQLSEAARPSFIGPISVTSFSYGSLKPDLEIRDVRDVWRVFDQGEEEAEELMQEKQREREIEDGLKGLDGEKYELVDYVVSPDESYTEEHHNHHDIHEFGHAGGRSLEDGHHHNRNALGTSYENGGGPIDSLSPGRFDRPPPSSSLSLSRAGVRPTRPLSTSSYSTTSGNQPFIPMPMTFALPLDPYSYSYTSHLPSTPGLNPSLFSGGGGASRISRVGMGSASALGHGRRQGSIISLQQQQQHQQQQSQQKRITSAPPLQDRGGHGLTQTRTSISASPPAHPSNLRPPSQSKSQSSSVPSLQLHVHLSHTSDVSLTLLTSLQVNYPSKAFMALPLKLLITGFTLDAEIVLAYNGEKNRLHLTIVDEDGVGSSGEGLTTSNSTGSLGDRYNSYTRGGEEKPLPIGQRLLPNLQIESEIGHVDAHVLRNVGKVERFIVDVVRKTLVDELVFPNFHTIEL